MNAWQTRVLCRSCRKLNDLRIVVEDGQQILARQQHEHDGNGGSDDVLAKAQEHGFLAAVECDSLFQHISLYIC